MKTVAAIAVGLVHGPLLWAQAGQAGQKRLTFEVASVKATSVPAGVILGDNGSRSVRKGAGTQVPQNTGGPGTGDPGRIHYPLISLKELLQKAWGTYFEIEGPGWLGTQVVAVDATMPPDTTKDQFQEMLRNLIADRLGLKWHVGTKELAGYSLTTAKNGLKIKESAEQNEVPLGPFSPPTRRDADGFPVMPARAGSWCLSNAINGDHQRLLCQQKTMQDLAQTLGRMLKTVVADATGLSAKYDFALVYQGVDQSDPAPPANATDAAPLPDLFDALQSQLGLRLERKQARAEVFVVDHMEKTPGGN